MTTVCRQHRPASPLTGPAAAAAAASTARPPPLPAPAADDTRRPTLTAVLHLSPENGGHIYYTALGVPGDLYG